MANASGYYERWKTIELSAVSRICFAMWRRAMEIIFNRASMVIATGLVWLVMANTTAAFPGRGGGNCSSCHAASSPPLSLTITPNPIDIKPNKDGLLTYQVTSLGQSSSAVISVQGLENALLNANVGTGGGHWTHATGSGGTSWLSDPISDVGPYTMDLEIGASATPGTYPITVRFAGDGPYGSNTSFNLKISAAGVPGDYNGNGIVDAADYVLWRKGGPLQNEVDSPGIVNVADYSAWRARFGSTSGSGSTFEITSIPEAATVTLLIFGLLTIPLCHKRPQIQTAAQRARYVRSRTQLCKSE
jgi:hypothetical protein